MSSGDMGTVMTNLDMIDIYNNYNYYYYNATSVHTHKSNSVFEYFSENNSLLRHK